MERFIRHALILTPGTSGRHGDQILNSGDSILSISSEVSGVRNIPFVGIGAYLDVLLAFEFGRDLGT